MFRIFKISVFSPHVFKKLKMSTCCSLNVEFADAKFFVNTWGENRVKGEKFYGVVGSCSQVERNNL